MNLNIQSSEDKLRQHALYNYANKYNNLKTELASGYVRNLLAKAANAGTTADTLNETMKELFDTFFQGRRSLAPYRWRMVACPSRFERRRAPNTTSTS